ncbi:MAG: ribonucleoside reductase class II [Planctomycetota bacterium]|nr:ribonucleoside reductase class II [Planctomycetota bacterium]MDA1113947.1 ribonucleoside reductase class II [Planctomycetota bacterium]
MPRSQKTTSPRSQEFQSPVTPVLPDDLQEPSLSKNSCTVLANRYLAKDEITGEVVETPKGLFWRVATAVAAPEYRELGKPVGDKWSRRFYDLMATGTFMPNSPTLMNAGRSMGMLSACFVLPVEDSIDGIFTTLRHVALIQKAGGGTGFSFSSLRPDGSIVASSGGRTSGPLSFIDAYSSGTDAIQQGAFRRGANMGVMRCDHPDVLEFLRAKDDLSRWQNYNISVGVTNDWMQRVVDSPEERMVVANPNGGQKAWLRKAVGRRCSEADYDAFAAGEGPSDSDYWTYGQVMDQVIEHAWRNGEPGMLFVDRANEDNQVPNLGTYEATNPCVTGDTWVLTEEGPQQVSALLHKPTRVAVDGEWFSTSELGFFPTAVKQTYLLRCANGQELRLTEDHPVRKVTVKTRWRCESEWTELKDLKPGDEIVLHDHRRLDGWQGRGFEQEGYLLGLLQGDGALLEQGAALSVWSAKTADGSVAPGALSVMGAAEAALSTLNHRSDFSGFQAISNRSEWRAVSAPLRNLAAEFGMKPGAKLAGSAIEATSSDFHCGWLRGMFDADGSVQGNLEKGVSVRLAQGDEPLLQRAQRMLARLGVQSRILSRRAAGTSQLPDGKGGMRAYATKQQFELIISGSNLAMFAERIGFEDADKALRLQSLLGAKTRRANQERFVVGIESIAKDAIEEVYDVQVPGPNAFDANGLYVHNCGEQWLLPYGSCNLGSINLNTFFKADAPEAAGWEERFDWKGFDSAVHDSVRFLDDVITINNYPIDEIRERAEQERRIGLGVMGFADLLYQLGVRYGSEQSFSIARVLSARLTDQSLMASEALVEKDGRPVFTAWEGSKPETDGKPKRRNSHVTTVAPTGTISIISGCSGGIEPLFSLAFQRQVMKNAEGVPVIMKEVNEDFRAALIEAGCSATEIEAIIDIALEEGTIESTNLSQEMRDTFVTAHDVKPREHILMQAAWQSSIDNAVSKTINLPHDSTEDDVRTAYLLAWREGCKGVTVYRDGCRDMQPMALKEKETAAHAAAAPYLPLVPVKLPEIMPSVRVRQLTPFGNMHVKISVDPKTEREMEVFAQLGKGGDVANSDLEAICRMISLFLRCGGAINMTLKQLEGIGSSLTVPSRDGRIMSLADGLAKALERYMGVKERFGLHAILLGEVDAEQLHGNPSEKASTVNGSGSRVGTGTGGAFKIKCPSCEVSNLIFEEGCCKCQGCGYSQC